jgi:alpha-tubulin suppressor-like RCC1 family protein
MRRLALCLCVGCVVIFYAAGASAQGVINVCVKPSDGSMRIVGGPEDCKDKETFILWNQTGPPGADGSSCTVGDNGDGTATLSCEDGTSVTWTLAEPDGWLQIDSGYHHTCGVKTNGTVECWGRNIEGQSHPPPGEFIQVAAGKTHTCGIRPDDTVECWGSNDDGESSPPAGETFLQVSLGDRHSCGIKTDGTAECWGLAAFSVTTPPTGETFLQLAGRGFRHCGIVTGGFVTCWGEVYLTPDGVFTQITKGHCGIRADGTADCWAGFPPPDGVTFLQLASGPNHTCGVTTDGLPVCWGDIHQYNDGQMWPMPGTFSQLAAGYYHTCGIKTDGSVECWGCRTTDWRYCIRQ